ncbi:MULTISPECIES: TetR/AcrR family transcriptional regulator [Streptomyces]|jgi:AcrR family transcriptional regulator|uniref:TetR/AcrR family transcriptional regulator n=1 Tax=Streptomyces thermoviolaceus subsp. thermoviolaceus TaxID=66860 RepID=A0ABX0YZS0_STRTL|nr:MULTISPECIES: TetR/AcrR family transcriptional regulator [Streptomyces]WTD46112.1 TetR/AcrR family transcriptional regulator [Streptomyces thermoviolaceus]NJP16639.1 TetR/AcrR family transcriptional regulator [Streptomyces thermoviolaceus subsp. thermoviolaceus]RSS06850.1 TetR/AcrR family transcriptional regulator [Streptomyces sp. WAC00469]GGV80915.1 TetR family transcriptional regulator [Streptomyces thermoviolaceus subsp. apingens]GHA74535.1 TetR family transcriptional regulator [Strepto
MDNRSKIIEAAAELLEASPTGQVATRSVAEKAGVQQPVIYRLFGDKDRLLAAVVDHGFEQYLGAKRAAEESADPVADLRRGWDQHTQFALEHPNLYHLMTAPGPTVAPRAIGEMRTLLRGVLERVAQAGRLAVEPGRAVEIVMSANTGVALALLARPDEQRDIGLSRQVREIVLAGVLTPGPAHRTPAESVTVPRAATTLAALLRSDPPESFTAAERALLAEWLTRLAQDTTTSQDTVTS